MERLTLEQRVLVIKTFYQSKSCMVDTQTRLRDLLGLEPSAKQIRRVIKTFETLYTLEDVRKSAKASTKQNIDVEEAPGESKIEVLSDDDVPLENRKLNVNVEKATETEIDLKVDEKKAEFHKTVNEDCAEGDEFYCPDEGYTSTKLPTHKNRICNYRFMDPSVLCDICGMRLSHIEKLKFHRRTHTGDKPYSCQTCSKSFSRKDNLRVHERVHTGERPFVCKFCDKCFTQRGPQRIHERTHTGEKPYVCKFCDKGFYSKGALDAHLKNCDGGTE